MMLKSLALAVAVLAVAQFISPSAKSDTLNVHGSVNFGSEGPSFYTDTVTFNLPVGFTKCFQQLCRVSVLGGRLQSRVTLSR